MSFVIEPLAQSHADVLELVAADPMSKRVIDALTSKGVTRIVPRSCGEPALVQVPGLTVVVGDGRGGHRDLRQLAHHRRPDAAAVAVALVAPSRANLAPDLLAEHFEAVLTIAPSGGESAAEALTAGVRAVTGFARGDLVGLAVDSVYPFYARGGCRLSYGTQDALESKEPPDWPHTGPGSFVPLPARACCCTSKRHPSALSKTPPSPRKPSGCSRHQTISSRQCRAEGNPQRACRSSCRSRLDDRARLVILLADAGQPSLKARRMKADGSTLPRRACLRFALMILATVAGLAQFANREYRITVSLKPQDVLVLLKLAARNGDAWSYPSLAAELSMSASEVHASVRRAAHAGLLNEATRSVNRRALLEFLVHAVKYVFPAERGGIARGLPTAHAAPPLRAHFRSTLELPPVWADPEGSVRGEQLEPLYRSVPRAARADARLYEWLALVDAVRGGRARERELAVKELRSRLS